MAEQMNRQRLYPSMMRGGVANCNTTMLNGLYYFSDNTINAPFVGYGCLIVTNHYGSESWVIQIAVKINGNSIYFRATSKKTFDENGWLKLGGNAI